MKSCIQEYTTDGTHLRSLAHIEPPKTHELVIFDNDRNLVAVTDGNVIFYDITSSPEGTLLSQFSFINREIASETINGYPRDIAIDNEGNVLLSDVNSTRVQVYSAKGDFIRSIGMSTTDPKTLKDSKVLISPIGIAIHPTNGNIVVGDSGQIQIFDTHGHVVQVIGGNSIPGSTRDSIDPYGVVVDRDGNIVSHDHADSSIQIFDQEGRYLTDFKILTIGGLKDNASNGPVLHPNGDIIIISYTDSLVFVYGEVPPEPEDLSDWFL